MRIQEFYSVNEGISNNASADVRLFRIPDRYEFNSRVIGGQDLTYINNMAGRLFDEANYGYNSVSYTHREYNDESFSRSGKSPYPATIY
jgi:hypothetical protein